MYHKVIIVGNLGNDPELRFTAQGDGVTSFSVAVNNTWFNKDGEKQEETTWFRVSVWGKQAESCNQYLSKGRQVLVEGRLQPDKATGGPKIWTPPEGNARASYDLRAITVQFLSGGGQSSDGPSDSGRSEADSVAEEEIPF